MPSALQQDLLLPVIPSWLAFCNCLLMGTPGNSVIQPLQKIQNFAARLILLCMLQGNRQFSLKEQTLNTSPGKASLASHFRTY